MSEREIEIVVKPTGEVTVEAFGFEDSSCHQASQEIIEAVGGVKKSTPKTQVTRNVNVKSSLEQKNKR